MPEHEFEIYLSVLSRLLKLTPEQTASIEDELRDHLEERFEELVRSGVERDEAIKQALDEFGDASGLAVNLTRVSQKPVRRWVIGSSIVSAVALLVAATVFLTSEPDGVSLPVTSSAVAQSKLETSQPIKPESLLLDPQPDDLDLQQITESSSIHLVEDCPLSDALETLATTHNVPIVIDRVGLDDVGLSADLPLNVPRLGVNVDESTGEGNRIERKPSSWKHQPTLAQTLDVILQEAELTWYVRDGIINVTNPDVESGERFARSYNVEPLVRAGVTPETLTQLLETHTRSSWENIDGMGGRVSMVGSVLTVWQSYQAHREVRQLLLKLAAPGGHPWVDFALERESLGELLARSTSVNFVEGTPLVDFVNFLSHEAGVGIVIDQVALSESGISDDVPLNIPVMEAASWNAVLRMAFDEHGLTLQLKDGVPTVTTVDVAMSSGSLTTAIHRVSNLLQPDREATAVSDAIQATAGGEWEEIDGGGGVLTLTENGLLVVSQTPETHRSIQRLLAIWESSTKTAKSSVSVSSAPVTKFYHMPIETAESLKTVIPDLVAPSTWKSETNPQGGTVHAVALAQKPPTLPEPEKSDEPSDSARKRAKERKTASTGDEPIVVFAQFGGGLGGGTSGVDDNVLEFYSQSTGVLVITQTSDVHREIDRFLASLRVSTRGRNEATANDVGKSPFGGMGGGGGFF